MRRLMWRHLVFVLVLFGIVGLELAGAPPAKEKKPQARPAAPPAAEFTLGKPLEFKNLAVFPVLSRAAKNEDAYITLDEGLKAGTVVISEIGAAGRELPARGGNAPVGNALPSPVAEDPFGAPPAQPAAAQRPEQPRAQAARPAPRPSLDPPATRQPPRANDAQRAGNRAAQVDDLFGDPAADGAQVNRLVVINRADRPLYLMPGEIIIGGQQDRTLAHETIVPPGKQPVPLDVYCVEHGRWAGRAGNDTVRLAQTIAQAESVVLDPVLLSDKAEKGEFVKSAGNLSKASRQAVQAGKGQGAVWDEVRSQNRKSGASTQSDAFTANYAQQNVVEKLQPYLQQLQEPVAKQDRIVGVIVAINGKPEMADVFNSTPLFRKLWPKLLKSYALDASYAAAVKESKPCTVADAQAFLDSASRAAVVDTSAKGHGLVVTAQSSEHIDSFSASPAAAGECVDRAASAYGGFGSGVHSSAFSK